MPENLPAATTRWTYLFALPNLQIKRGPYDATIESKHVAIVAHDDPRINFSSDPQHCAPRRLQQSFSDYRGTKVNPSALIATSSAPRRVYESGCLRSFRNAATLAAIVPARANALADDGQWQVMYSDHFDFFPIAPSKKPGHYVSTEGPVIGFDEAKETFKFQPYPHLGHPASHRISADEHLWGVVKIAWDLHYLKGRHRKSLTNVFRSLDVANVASRFPSRDLGNFLDIGIHIGLWVSAFETLVHPGNRNVNAQDIVKELGQIDWSAKLSRKTYTHVWWKKGTKQVDKVNFPQKLYLRLYRARNNYFHGGNVARSEIFFSKPNDSGRLDFCIPLLYAALLKHRLGSLIPECRTPPQPRAGTAAYVPWFKNFMEKRDSQRKIEIGLTAVMTGRSRFQK